jgi:hypothetical protein
MLGDTRAPLDNREGDCIIDIPLAKLVTKGNSFELVLIEESGLDDPGHDLLLEWFAHQDSACVDDATYIVILDLKNILAESLPQGLLALLDRE